MSDVISSGKAWAKELIELYTQGYSDAEVAAHMKITISEYYKQMQDTPAFAKLVEFGRTLSQAFWEGQGRKNLTNKQFNTPLWAFYMKNKFGWADKSEVKSESENVNVELDSLRTRVNEEVARFIKRNTPELTDAQRMLTNMRAENDQNSPE